MIDQCIESHHVCADLLRCVMHFNRWQHEGSSVRSLVLTAERDLFFYGVRQCERGKICGQSTLNWKTDCGQLPGLMRVRCVCTRACAHVRLRVCYGACGFVCV